MRLHVALYTVAVLATHNASCSTTAVNTNAFPVSVRESLPVQAQAPEHAASAEFESDLHGPLRRARHRDR